MLLKGFVIHKPQTVAISVHILHLVIHKSHSFDVFVGTEGPVQNCTITNAFDFCASKGTAFPRLDVLTINNSVDSIVKTDNQSVA